MAKDAVTNIQRLARAPMIGMGASIRGIAWTYARAVRTSVNDPIPFATFVPITQAKATIIKYINMLTTAYCIPATPTANTTLRNEYNKSARTAPMRIETASTIQDSDANSDFPFNSA